MAESTKTALRQLAVTLHLHGRTREGAPQTSVSLFTMAAVAGLTTRERIKLFQAEWAERAKNDDPCRFVDKSGRRWENARYV